MAILKTLSLIIVFLLAVVLAGLSTVLVKPDLLRGVIDEGARRFAGLHLHIGNIDSHMNPLRIEIQDLRLENPDWSDGEHQGELLEIAQLRLQLTRLPFSSQPFWDLEASGVGITVARDQQGKLNWISDELAAGETAPPEEENNGLALPADFNFNHIRLRNVALLWRSGDMEQQLRLPLINAQRVTAGNGEFRLEVSYREQAFALEGAVELFDPQQSILNYRLNLSHQDLDLKTAGRLVLSPDLKGSEIDIGLALQSLQQLGKLADTELPELPAIDLSATLAFTPDYEIRDLQLSSGDSRLSGQLTVTQKLAIRADLQIAMLDIDQLFPPEEDAAAPSSEPEETQAGSEESAIDWAWLDTVDVDLKAQVDTLTARGWSIQNMQLASRIKDRIGLELSAAEVTQTEGDTVLRQFTALSLNGKAQPLAASTEGADLKVDLKLKQEDIALDAKGDVNVNGLAGTALKIGAQAPSSATVWSLADLPWQEAGALAIEASIASDGQRHSATGDASMGQQSGRFDVSYQDGGARPKLQGLLALSKLDLGFISDAPPLAEAQESSQKPAAKAGRVFASDALDLSALTQLDADMELRFSDIDTGYNTLKQATLKPSLSNGKLLLPSTTLEFVGGRAEVSAELDSNRNVPQLQTRIDINGEDFGQLGLDKAAGISGGEGRIRLQANSSGQSPAALAANLDARLDAKVTDLQARGNALNLIGSDLLSELIDKLNPFAKKKTSTDIECVAIHFKGDEGKLVSDSGIALETDDTKIIGSGSVDLAEEEMSFGISPIARKGVGINIGAAAGLVRLGGSLSNPRIVADPSGMISGGLSTSAAIYTGGLSLLAQSMYKRALHAGSACDGDLEDIPQAEELPEELINPPAPVEEAAPAP